MIILLLLNFSFFEKIIVNINNYINYNKYINYVYCKFSTTKK